MSGIIIGIDPGLHGGMARLEPENLGDIIELEAIPILPAKKRKGRDGKMKKISRDQYDLQGIRRLLKRWTENNDAEKIPDLCVYVEQSFPLPPNLKAGSLAQFQRGVSRGWLWMLTALELPHELVHPRTWMSKMHFGLPGKDNKVKSIMAAGRLFPGVDLRRTERSRVPHDGFAEALLIAEYGRRYRTGLED